VPSVAWRLNFSEGDLRIERDGVYLDDGKTSTVSFHLGPVDVALPARYITSLWVGSFVEVRGTGADKAQN